jgi:SAM-dependent methyltransferase
MSDSSADERPGHGAADEDAARVQAEYARRAQDDALRRYYEHSRSAIEEASVERRTLMLEFVDRLGPRDASAVLDVGCGIGGDLAYLAGHGFAAERLSGIDLLEERIVAARISVPGADLRVGNAAQLPYPDASFGVVLQSVVLSSVTDASVRAMIAGEMARVVRPGGLLISYDMRTLGSANLQLTKIDEPEVRRLFGAVGQIEIRTLTLNIGMARRVGPIAARVLRRLPPLRTHLLAVVTRRV